MASPPDEQDLLWQELRKNVDQSRLTVIHLTKDDGGFGFNIRGGIDHPHIGTDPGIFVTAVREDGVAGKDGRLETGDRILAVNATRLDNISHDNAVDAFRTTEDTVSLLVEKNAESYILASPVLPSPGVAVGSPYPLKKEEKKPHTVAEKVCHFFQSHWGALTVGIAVGAFAIFLIRKYKHGHLVKAHP